MTIFEKADYLIKIIENAGYEAYLVGGCVRDFFMNKPCDDIDITTSAKPIELEKILTENKIKYIETGLKHGTVTALIESDSFEITTYRTDGEYSDNRHPENVKFVSNIDDDLSRRDFTVNAIAFNPNKNEIVDLFGGKKDIENKVIKAVGNADVRFNEDALRIMRAVRFSSTLSFNIEEKTKTAIFKNKDLLKNVSKERLFSELSKLLMGDNVFSVLTEYKEVLAVIIPELIPTFTCKQNTVWHLYDVYTHTAKTVEQSQKKLSLRLTMLLHDLGKPQAKTTDDRVKDHDSKKAFWQKALVFVSKDEDMTKADVQYLEYRAIVVAKQSNSFVLNENKQIPKAPNLPEHQRDAMDEFFEDIRFLASFIGCDIFEISQPKEEHLFYTKARGCNANKNYLQ